MPTVPYKYLKDENFQDFYPMIGESSFTDPVSVASGGTGADTAAGARANLGAISATDASLVAGAVPYVLDVANGGTSASTVEQARENLGLNFKMFRFNWQYTVGANQNYSANFKTLVDAKLPSGYYYAALGGYDMNNGNLYMVNISYDDSQYSFTCRNTTTSAITVTTTFFVLAVNHQINTETIDS